MVTGDSKSYASVKEIYGTEITVRKLECIGHVQKMVGTRLRKLKKKKEKTRRERTANGPYR